MTTEEIQKLRDERAKLVADMRIVLDKADEEKRDITSDENTNYENMEKRMDEVDKEIKDGEEAIKKTEERLQALADKEAELKKSQDEPTKIDPNDEKRSDLEKAENREDPEYRAFCSFLAGQDTAEVRALQADKDVAGGFMVAPEQFVANLIKEKDRLVWIRQFATVLRVTGSGDIGFPELADDPDDSDWTAEIRTGTEDTAMDFEKRALHPHPSAKRIKVSEKLIRISAIPVDSLVNQRLGYKFGITEEKAFISASGANKPLGLFTAHASGIGTGRDVTAGNTTTAIKADGLINTKYSLEAQYRMNCRWLFHRDAIKMIRKLKDGDGNYIWKAGIASDRPDTILEFPVHESEYAPSIFTTGLYVGILGDFSFYWIVDSLSMTIKVLTELYAETAQIGYIGRMEVDGAPIHEKAFARVKLA